MDNCNICYKNSKYTFNVPCCSGIYCKCCLMTWFNQNPESTCPTCRHVFTETEKKDLFPFNRLTRSQTLNDRTDLIKDKLEDLLNKTYNCDGKSKRIEHINNIMKIIYNNIWFLDHDIHFRKTVLYKLREFYVEDNWKEAYIWVYKFKKT